MAQILPSPTNVPPAFQSFKTIDRLDRRADSISSSSDESIVHPSHHLDNNILEQFPNILSQPYNFQLKYQGSNSLVFLHNALKKEFVQLFSIIIPAIQLQYQMMNGNEISESSHQLWIKFGLWWKGLLGFIFFVAEHDEKVVNELVDITSQVALRSLDAKFANELRRSKKSLKDRYAYSLEVVLRAVDRALDKFEENPNNESLNVAIDKIMKVVHFVLESTTLAYETASKCDSACDISIKSIEGNILENLPGKSKSEKLAYMYMCVNWMQDEAKQRKWMHRHTTFPRKQQLEQAKQKYSEERASLVEDLIA